VLGQHFGHHVANQELVLDQKNPPHLAHRPSPCPIPGAMDQRGGASDVADFLKMERIIPNGRLRVRCGICLAR
jgi:hypothetical protein